MNATDLFPLAAQWLAEAPFAVNLGVKATLLLALVWFLQVALRRKNPRWRVLVWRGAFVALVLLPLASLYAPPVEVTAPAPEMPVVEAALVKGRPVGPIRIEFPTKRPTEQPSAYIATNPPIALPPKAGGPREFPGVPRPSYIEIAPPVDITARPAPSLFEEETKAQRSAPWWLWRVLLSAAWLAGALLLLLRMKGGRRALGELIARSRPAPDELRLECLRVCADLGCPSTPDTRIADGLTTPFLANPGRPLLLLPSALADEAYRDDWRAILAHEVSHLRSRDLGWAFLANALSIALWPHPLAWRMSRSHASACEEVCDAVSADYVSDVHAYSKTLARVALEASSGRLATAGIPMARTSQIARRLDALSRRVFSASLSKRAVWTACVVGALVVVGLAGLRVVLAQEEPAVAEATTTGEKAAKDNGQLREGGVDVDPGALADEVVSRPTGLRLRVVDDETGEPLEGVKVANWFSQTEGSWTTDDDGRCFIERSQISPKVFQISVRSDDHVPVTVTWAPTYNGETVPADYELRLERGVEIGGVVRDEDGAPIEGAEVRVHVEPRPGGAVNPTLIKIDRKTGRDGRWRCRVTLEDVSHVSLSLSHPDYQSDDPQGVRRTALVESLLGGEATLVMKRGRIAEGRVLDPGGMPIADAIVQLTRDEVRTMPMGGGAINWHNTYPGETPPNWRKTGDDGRFVFTGVPMGKHNLIAVAAGMAPNLAAVNVGKGKPVDISLEPGHTIRVKVVDSSGASIEGARIRLESWRRVSTLNVQLLNEVFDKDDPRRLRSHTGADGVWTWNTAPNDQVLVRISADNHRSLNRVAVTARDEGWTAKLEASLVVSGRVVDAITGLPIAKFRTLDAYLDKGVTDLGQSRVRSPWRKESDGQYQRGLSQWDTFDGDYYVRVRAEGYREAVSPPFAPDAGSVVHDFALERAEVTRGRVTRADGSPIAGARVVPLADAGQLHFVNGVLSERSTWPGVKTDADGVFSVTKPSRGSMLLVSHAEGWAEAAPSQLTAGEAITLEPWGRVEGVYLAGTKPLAGRRIDIDLYGQSSTGPGESIHTYSTTTDGFGRFTFDRVRPGQHDILGVVVFPFDGGHSRMTERSTGIRVKSGETTNVQLGGVGRAVIGRVTMSSETAKMIDWSRVNVDLTQIVPRPPRATPTPKPGLLGWLGLKPQPTPTPAPKTPKPRQYTSATTSGKPEFRIEDVEEGHYRLYVRLAGADINGRGLVDTVAQAQIEVRVPAMPTGRSDEPLDVGAIEVKPFGPRNVIRGASSAPETIRLEKPLLPTPTPKPTPRATPTPEPTPQPTNTPVPETSAEPNHGDGNAEVHVVDAETGEPIAGALVRRSGFDVSKDECVTDENGRFRTQRPSSRAPRSALHVFAPGYAPSIVSWDKSATVVAGEADRDEVRLVRGVVIGGSVVDEDGRPISGVTVRVGGRRGFSWRNHYSMDGVVRVTGADGRWECNVLREDFEHLEIRLAHPDYQDDEQAVSAKVLTPETLLARAATFEMKRGRTITGRVVDPDGNPIEGATVQVGELRDSWDKLPWVSTGSDGGFAFSSAALDDLPVAAVAPGLAPDMVMAKAGSDQPVVLTLAPGRTLRLLVSESEGVPLAEFAWVQFGSWRGARVLSQNFLNREVGKRDSHYLEKITDARGRWVWKNAPADEVGLRIRCFDNQRVKDVSVTAREAVWHINMGSGLSISGRVIDAETREPVGPYHIRDGWAREHTSDTRRLTTGSNWRVKSGAFREWRPGFNTPYSFLRVWADGYLPATSRLFLRDEGEVQYDFELKRAGMIRGRVVRENGRAAKDAIVVAHGIGRRLSFHSGKPILRVADSHTLTDRRGAFELTEPLEGSSLFVHHEDGCTMVGPDEMDDLSRIVLAPWGRVEGRHLLGDKPLADRAVSLVWRSKAQRQALLLSFGDGTKTDAQGRFAFERVIPGDYAILSSFHARTGYNIIDMAHGRWIENVEVLPRETTNVQIGGRGRPVTGRVKLVKSGQPTDLWTHAYISIAGKGTTRWTESTDAAGRLDRMGPVTSMDPAPTSPQRLYFVRINSGERDFRIEDIPPGDYWLTVEFFRETREAPEGERLTYTSRSVAVPPMSTVRSDEPLDVGEIIATPLDPSSLKAPLSTTSQTTPTAQLTH